jgi:hypothetical protein
MKTIFTRDEILEFIQSHNRTLDGENTLFKITSIPQNLNSLVDGFKHIRDVSKEEGKMTARMEMIESLLIFFEIDFKIDNN